MVKAVLEKEFELVQMQTGSFGRFVFSSNQCERLSSKSPSRPVIIAIQEEKPPSPYLNRTVTYEDFHVCRSSSVAEHKTAASSLQVPAATR